MKCRGVLTQATVATMKQAYEHLTPKDCIVEMIKFSELFKDMILKEIAANKERLELSEGAKELLDLAIAVREGMRNDN